MSDVLVCVRVCAFEFQCVCRCVGVRSVGVCVYRVCVLCVGDGLNLVG